jgi:hypothetical protein
MARWIIVAAIALAALAACNDPGPVCGAGYCPEGTVCTSSGDHCVAPGQVGSCRGSTDGTTCDISLDRQGVCVASDCVPTECGDGKAEGPEECDGSALRDPAHTDCLALGEGYHRSGALSCTATCTLDRTACGGRCGDGVVQRDAETCDGAVGDMTCVAAGFYSGVMGCSATCELDTSACVGRCGDGIRTAGEACDRTDFGAQSCTSNGFYGGELTCTEACTVETTGCVGRCGDGIKNGSEVCDGADLAGLSCQSFGWHDGAITCGADCISVDRTACSGYCGDGVKNGDEVCDGLDHDDISCSSLGAIAGALGCNAFCQPSTEACYWGALRPVARIRSSLLRAAWSTSPRDIWASSDEEYLLHFDGRQWTSVDVGLQSPVSRFWSGRDGYAWAHTVGGQLAYHDGQRWTVAHDGLAGFRVAATTPSNIWAVDGRTGRHFNGSSWWSFATSARNVYTFGQGTVWLALFAGMQHYDGRAWTYHDLGRYGACVWGTGNGDLYTTTRTETLEPVLLHYDGGAWTQQERPFGVDPYCGWSDGADRMWMNGTVGEQTVFVLIDRGASWLVPIDSLDTTAAWTIDGQIWSFRGSNILRLDGPAWTSRGMATEDPVNALWVSSPTSAWVGTLGEVYFASPDAPQGPFPVDGDVHTLWATESSTWIGGSFGLTRYSSSGFEPQDIASSVNALWGTSAQDLWAYTWNQLLHFDGTAWSVALTHVTGGAAALAGTAASNLWAFFEGDVYRHDEGTWTPVEPVTASVELAAIATGAPDDLWLFDTSGSSHQYDGETASPLRGTWAIGIGGAWAQSPRNVWALGDGLHHYDGVTWSRVSIPPGLFTSALGGGSDTVWLGGAQGATYNLPATLPEPDGGACSSVLRAYCNVSLRGHTAQTIDGPTDCNGVAHPGGELHYKIEVPVTGRLSARVTSRYGVDLAAVRAGADGGCDVAGCAAPPAGDSGGEVVLDVERGQTYFLVIGAANADTPFTLDVACEKR